MSDGGRDLKNQFLIEGRDLVETAGDCLLQLEKEPEDRVLIGALFRAVHTLKGNSGLFAVAPLTRVVHAAEDLLDEVRAGTSVLNSEMADVLLQALDQVSDWLRAFEFQESLPEDAPDVASVLAERLAEFRSDFTSQKVPEAAARMLAADWLDGLDATERAAAEAALQAGGPMVMVDYSPDSDCFFRGEDPLLFMLTLPGRNWLAVTPTAPLVPGPHFDPFGSILRFRAITTASLADVRTHLAYVAAQVAIGTTAGQLPVCLTFDPVLLGMLEATAEALACEGSADVFEGRMASTARALAVMLPQTGLCSAAEIQTAGELALSSGDAAALKELVALVLERSAAPAADATPANMPEVPAPAAVQPKAPTPTSVQPEEPAAVRPKSAAPRRQTFLKVDQARIDMLMKLAGELIVAKNGLPFLVHRAEDVYGSRALAREIRVQFDVFNRIVDELQTAVMQVRMVPMSLAFDRFRRLVRDLSRQVDKPIAFIVEGEETEADRNIVEDLSEPLIHLIRNAIDHGLETLDERIAADKSPEGKLRLCARLADDKLVIEVSDDGRGIDVARVRAKAVERGLITADEAVTMSEDSALRLILRPGFSTVNTISNLSGRGVGMDVVTTMVERTGGTLSLSHEPGQGTTVLIALPLSMTVRRMMMVEIEGAAYGIPLETVLETVRVPPAKVHLHMGQPQIVRRDLLIPLCDLRKVLRLGSRHAAPDELSVLIVKTAQGQVGLIVDAFRSGAEVIPQPLDGPLAGLTCLSGAALLGDGSILMILDVEEVLKCPW